MRHEVGTILLPKLGSPAQLRPGARAYVTHRGAPGKRAREFAHSGAETASQAVPGAKAPPKAAGRAGAALAPAQACRFRPGVNKLVDDRLWL